MGLAELRQEYVGVRLVQGPARGWRGLRHLRECWRRTHAELSRELGEGAGDSNRQEKQEAPLHLLQPPAPTPPEGEEESRKP